MTASHVGQIALWSAIVCLGLASLAATVSYGAGAHAGIEVLEIAWSRSVADREPAEPHGDTARAGNLVFWTRLAGREEALAQLRQQNKLPIRHRWWRYRGPATDPDQAMLEHDLAAELDVELSAGEPSRAAQLALETLHRQFFDWRTWSTRPAARPGIYCVEVLFRDNEPVPLAQGVRTNGPSTCRFQIRVE
jgi:hypothetical protein